MNEWDAYNGLKESEYEIIYLLRDMLKLYTEQQIAIFGSTTETLKGFLSMFDACIESEDG
ncbi:MAG: hypothetical protein J5707_00950 [Candidatus Methanomethylophilus sp.]|nr:hypothetical protein [Methanomethylophilus sp.]